MASNHDGVPGVDSLLSPGPIQHRERTMDAEERAQISRSNGRKSRGPKSDQGKRISSRNSYRHGRRTESLAIVMAHEDPDDVAARIDDWYGFYKPRSPAARHATDRCIASTFAFDRSQLAHDSILADQVDKASVDFHLDREAAADDAWAGRLVDPAAALDALRSNGHGVRRLIDSWRWLGGRLEECGCWSPPEAAELARLLGA